MVIAKDIKVVLACLFPNTDPLWMMLHTCKRFGIEPLLYGQCETYKGWVDIKIKLLRDAAREVKAAGFSHILYTDARDAWFCRDLHYVAETYNNYGAPPLMLGTQYRQFPGMEKWYREYPEVQRGFRYPATPGIIADAEVLADALDWMYRTYPFGADRLGSFPDDDPAWWCSFDRDRPGELVLEHYNKIFMNVGDMPDGEWDIRDGLAYNKITDTYPAILHFNGGYSHALYGKWEALEKYWRAFGYAENPPWEVK